jgi:regulatory protein YycI of two-component signal transduction system YycFG
VKLIKSGAISFTGDEESSTSLSINKNGAEGAIFAFDCKYSSEESFLLNLTASEVKDFEVKLTELQVKNSKAQELRADDICVRLSRTNAGEPFRDLLDISVYSGKEKEFWRLDEQGSSYLTVWDEKCLLKFLQDNFN